MGQSLQVEGIGATDLEEKGPKKTMPNSQPLPMVRVCPELQPYPMVHMLTATV